MSLLTYNGVKFPYPLTTQFKQKAVADESDTDWCISEFDITVQTIFNNSYLQMLANELALAPSTTPVDIMNVVRSKLLKRRRILSFVVNGRELIPVPVGIPGEAARTFRGYVDVQNGPKPETCDITQLTDSSFLVTYRIVAHYWEKINIDVNRSPIVLNRRDICPVLSNRWSEVVDIDQSAYTKKNRVGKFIIRSDNLNGERADFYRRRMAQLAIPTGFIRESAQYKVSPDGLGIEYNIVDKEQYKLPPAGAFEARGHSFEGTSTGGGVRNGEVYLWLRGAKTSSQVNLVETAIAIAAGKFIIMGGAVAPGIVGVPEGAVMQAFGVKIGMYDNTVEVNIKGLLGVRTRRRTGIASLQANTFTPFSDPGGTFVGAVTPLHPLRGTAGLLLRAAAHFDPSLALAQNSLSHVGDLAGQTISGREPGEVGRLGEDPLDP